MNSKENAKEGNVSNRPTTDGELLWEGKNGTYRISEMSDNYLKDVRISVDERSQKRFNEREQRIKEYNNLLKKIDFCKKRIQKLDSKLKVFDNLILQLDKELETRGLEIKANEDGIITRKANADCRKLQDS